MNNPAVFIKDVQRIVEYFPDAILVTNTQLVIIEANEEAKKIFCATGNELNGRFLQEFIPALNSGFIKDQLEQKLLSISTSEFKCITLSGSDFPANLKFRMFNDFIVCAISVVTGFAPSERNQLSDIVICSDDAIISEDLNGKILSWNAGAEKLFLYAANEVIGKPLSFIIPPDKLNEEEIILNHIKDNQSNQLETRRMRKDGSLVYVSLTVSPIKDLNGQVIGAAKIARDITERIDMVNRLIHQNKKLEDFTQIVTHNLRSPIHNLHALLHLYKLEDITESKEAYISKFEHSVDNLRETINQLMNILDVKYNSERPPVLIKFQDVFNKIISACESDIIKLHAAVTGDFSGLEVIKYIPEYMESIMQNLLTNALKYYHAQRNPVIHFKTKKQDGNLLLTVSDNGIGIDLKLHGNKLFGFHKTFHKHPEARGVGLYITKAQVEAMGGTIQADSKVNEGTTFKIIFNQKP